MSEIAQAFVRIRPSTTGFKAEAERDVKRGLGGIGKVIGGAFAAVGLEEGVRKVAEAAAAQQEELSVVRQAIKSTSAEWEIHGHTVDDVLRDQAVKFGFTVADLAQGFTRIQVSTKDTTKSLSLLNEAEDIARARHLSLAQSSVVVAKAQAGNVTGLQRLGIVIPKVTDNYDALKKRVDEARAGGARFTKEQELQIRGSYERAKALDAEATKQRINTEIQQRFGGQAANFAKTAEGSSQRFHEAVNELEVSVGNGLLPTLTKAAAGATALFKELANGGQVEAFAAGSAHELASAYDLVVGIAKEIAPPLTAAAKAVGTLAHAAGGGGIVAFVAGYKALGLAIGIAEKARLRYDAVVAAGTGQAAAEAAAANTSTNATVRRTAATVASADAVEAESIALAKNVDAMLASQAVAARLADEQAALAAKYEITNVAAFGGGKLIRDASGQFVTSTAKVDAFANSAERAGSKLGNLSRGLFALAGGWTTVAAVGLGAAAFGIYKLVTADSALEQANQRVMDSQRDLDATLQNSALLRQRLAALTDAIPDQRLAVARAKLNEEDAKNALLTTQAAKSSTAYRNLQLGVLEAIQNRRQAEKALNDTVDARTKTENAQSFNDRRRTRQAREAAGSIAANASAINAAHERSARAGLLRGGVPADSPSLVSALLRARQAAAAEFARKTDQAAENEKNKTIRRNDELIATYARQFKKTPSPPLIRFILDNKNAKASLHDILVEFRNTGRTGAIAAHAQGEHIGREYGAGLTAGIDESTATAAAAAARGAHRIAEAAKTVLGIKSPSEVMRREVGHKISEGIALGILDRNGAVVGAISNQVDQAVAAGIQSVRDSVASAKQNLNSIGGSLSSDIGTLLDKRGQTGQAGASTPAQNARLHALLQQIHAGQGGTDTVRLAQALSNQVVQHASVAQATSSDSRAEQVQRRIANLTDLLNRGSIRSEAVFDRRLNSILKGAGIGSGFGRSSLGIAFSDQLRADVQGLRDQARAILQGPRVRGSGLEPQIVKPLDAIKAAQQQIADAAKAQRDAQLAEAKRQTAEAKKHTKHLKDIADHTKGTATTKDVASWIDWAEKHPKAATDALVATNTRHGHGR